MNLDTPEVQPLSPTPGPYVTKRFRATKSRTKSVSLGAKVSGANNVNSRATVTNPPGTNPPSTRSKSKKKRR